MKKYSPNPLFLSALIFIMAAYFPVQANPASGANTAHRQLVRQQTPSSLPPGGLKPEQVPQFVVIGFDDNTLASGMDWAAQLLADRKNPPGIGNARTYDGTPARISFYMNTEAMGKWLSDNPVAVTNSLKNLYQQGHEIGNHTHNHHADLKPTSDWEQFAATITRLSGKEWAQRIGECTQQLEQRLELPPGTIIGFRAPYLKYNQSMLDYLKQQSFLYDCSIEEGYATQFDGTNFRWPYTLHKGSPGHNENWNANPANPNRVELSGTPELWELPNHVLMVPDDEAGIPYGIPAGLWKRILEKQPHLQNHRLTGFDYNLWVNTKLTKSEFVGLLKYNLDLRLQGNRAPFMFGAHTQYYTDPQWAVTNAPQVTQQEMQRAIQEFVDYALSKPEVRIRPARDIIHWCRQPVPLTEIVD